MWRTGQLAVRSAGRGRTATTGYQQKRLVLGHTQIVSPCLIMATQMWMVTLFLEQETVSKNLLSMRILSNIWPLGLNSQIGLFNYRPCRQLEGFATTLAGLINIHFIFTKIFPFLSSPLVFPLWSQRCFTFPVICNLFISDLPEEKASVPTPVSWRASLETGPRMVILKMHGQFRMYWKGIKRNKKIKMDFLTIGSFRMVQRIKGSRLTWAF